MFFFTEASSGFPDHKLQIPTIRLIFVGIMYTSELNLYNLTFLFILFYTLRRNRRIPGYESFKLI